MRFEESASARCRVAGCVGILVVPSRDYHSKQQDQTTAGWERRVPKRTQPVTSGPGVVAQDTKSLSARTGVTS
jgi:hypothetical protein